ncbi:hypothetical protein [Clostridium cylindrosporum]|uniref:Terminase-like family n=1 Tax=Clostridium cylindrosporum DSM 605 TaxID=1121307 RepID=A0A0J8DB39_CLOCY|nr:hypothetical protein [Clostridium cylindrosporum]KMT21509.1 terminase-like family [Clostridium cylindrosporum DSM 605]
MNRDERFLKVWNNPILFIQNFMKVSNKVGKEIPFILNPMQREFLNNMSNYNIILKARQGGMSTSLAAQSLYYAITEPNSHCLMLSHREESTRAIFNKLKQLYNTIPEVLKPQLLRNNRAELAFSNGSVITCQTMGNKDVGRGSTLKFIHISEYAFVNSEVAEKQLLSLEQALRPDGVLCIESTANSLNFFHDLYFKSKKKENAYKSFFFNYIDTASMFKDEFKKCKKLFKNINNHDFSEDDLTDEEKELLKIEGMTLDILCWRRLKISNAGIEQFNQEYPLTDIDAFISSGNSVFDAKRVTDAEKALLINKTKHISKDKLKDLPTDLKRCYGKSLFIYKDVVKGERFAFGIDCSEGVNGDYSVIIVLDSQGELVAEYYDNNVKPYLFADIVNSLGRYYNNALLTIEKQSAGHSVIMRLRMEHKYYNMTKYRSYDKLNRPKFEYGFDTNSKTKSLIINDMVELFEKGQLKINSRRLLQEMKQFEIRDNGRMCASGRGHDDMVMATSLSIVSMLHKSHYKM